MDLPEIAQCRSCDAQIRWVVSMNGTRMPIDAGPDANGNLRLSTRSVDAQWRAQVVTGKQRDYLQGIGRAYISHHATCPQAGQWRQKRENR